MSVVIRVMFVIGTRPEAIRCARMLRLMEQDPQFDLTILNTGQHYDANMMGDFLRELDVPPPRIDLKVGSTTNPAIQVAAIIEGTSRELDLATYDVVCVFGDTNSTLGAAVAAAKTRTPLVHIEAGGRSYDMNMPEEINRRMTDHISGLLLCMCKAPATFLKQKNVLGKIEIVGDPQHDVYMTSVPKQPMAKRNEGLVTIHREENADDPQRIEEIFSALREVARQRNIEWVFPVHPRTKKNLPKDTTGIRLVEPLSYEPLLEQMFASQVCVTDSGGLVKEAMWARVPCITARDRCEWIETVTQGANVLAPAGSDMTAIILKQMNAAESIDFSNPYGDGDNSQRTVDAVREWVLSGQSHQWREQKLVY
jgi:UDP-N-acetylglucosamine 2-epimerase